MSHALLSPSSASRWLACPPSARLEEKFPDRSGEAAAEGTLAHELSELLIQNWKGDVTALQFFDRFRKIEANRFYCQEMRHYCEDFRDFVAERFLQAQAGCEDAKLFTETRLDMTAWVPEGFGTGDVIIIADGVLEIIDLKYGKGVPVDAHENKQMMLYALGALFAYDMAYGIHEVRMTIYQPRIDNISTYILSVEELLIWGEDILKPRADMAFSGKGDFQPGAHCRFCKAAAVCKANADFNLETVKHDFCDPVVLSDAELVEVLQRADLFRKWIAAVEEHAHREALDGKQWPGMKLVAGRSVRKIADELKAADALKAAGFPETAYLQPAKLQTITALEKAIGKAAFAETLGELVIKPEGAPALVPESDKRPALNSVTAVIADFS